MQAPPPYNIVEIWKTNMCDFVFSTAYRLGIFLIRQLMNDTHLDGLTSCFVMLSHPLKNVGLHYTVIYNSSSDRDRYFRLGKN